MAIKKRAANGPSAEVVEDLAGAMKALSDPNRLSILIFLARHGERNGTEVGEAIPLSQPTISHHLGVLVRAKFVVRAKRGVFHYFSLNPEAPSRLGRTLIDALGLS